MAEIARSRQAVSQGRENVTAAIPPHAFFLVSAIFHYLGPAFAVLLFDHVSVLGVAWLRIASAAVVFAVWRRPWRVVGGRSWEEWRILIALGIVLGAMNTCFYLAIDRLPLATVGAIEFLGPIALAAIGVRCRRNVLALGLAVGGVWFLTDVRLAGEPLGVALAFANCALFVLYVVLGHRIAREGGDGIDRLGMAMLLALVAVTPIGVGGAVVAFAHPLLLLAGIAVGICSSVIPYVCDQLAMARLPRATFALLLALLPACATVIGLVVLQQEPSAVEVLGIALIIGGVAVHRADNGGRRAAAPGGALSREEDRHGEAHNASVSGRPRREPAAPARGAPGPGRRRRGPDHPDPAVGDRGPGHRRGGEDAGGDRPAVGH